MNVKTSQLIPSLFTILNFGFGFYSIMSTMSGNLHVASWFIILAILCDGMDGKLARWTRCESPFGLQLDSLADLVSSAVAPAILVYRAAFTEHTVLGLLPLMYAFAGSFRLARFAIVQGGDRSKGYFGVPLPVAGMTIAAFMIFNPPVAINLSMGFWMGLLVFLAVLMVSSIHYQWPRLDFQGGWKTKLKSTGLSVGILALAAVPHWSLAPLFLAYILYGMGRWALLLIQGRVSIKTLFQHPDNFVD